jgi:hypothetical protein
MKTWTIFALIAFAGPAEALEIAPMTREQGACYGKEYAILAHVVDAHSYVCERRAPGCFPNYVGATAVIDEVIAPSREGLHVGDTVRVSFSVSQPAAFVRPEDLQYNGSIIFPDNHADEITDDFAKSQLVGRSFYFSIASIRRSLTEGIPSRVDDPYYTEAYPAGDGEWFRTTWASADCRNEQAKAEAHRRTLGLNGEP